MEVISQLCDSEPGHHLARSDHALTDALTDWETKGSTCGRKDQKISPSRVAWKGFIWSKHHADSADMSWQCKTSSCFKSSKAEVNCKNIFSMFIEVLQHQTLYTYTSFTGHWLCGSSRNDFGEPSAICTVCTEPSGPVLQVSHLGKIPREDRHGKNCTVTSVTSRDPLYAV